MKYFGVQKKSAEKEDNFSDITSSSDEDEIRPAQIDVL